MSSDEVASRDAFFGLSPIRRPRRLRLLPTRVWTAEQWHRIQRGHMAESMEGHWCAFAEGDRVFLHRTWTGYGIYEATFEPFEGGFRIAEAVVETHWRRYAPVISRYAAQHYSVLLEGVLASIAMEEWPADLQQRSDEVQALMTGANRRRWWRRK
ncbi:hypothetical protein [Yinghuangia soli]|uniref:Uncharacterized protein n=1 Tax=Yinghuangia soli TaxID=2908204 RepID=A0AA41PWR3_9ACTN|nr:hypothetical protein [Yinghuangia soli]MCF2526987.1 hypothetical protein [Yinghuangia soli]